VGTPTVELDGAPAAAVVGAPALSIVGAPAVKMVGPPMAALRTASAFASVAFREHVAANLPIAHSQVAALLDCVDPEDDGLLREFDDSTGLWGRRWVDAAFLGVE